MLESLGDWLARKKNSTGTPLELANQELHRHGTQMYECELCGVAKAIIDCEGVIREEAAFNFVEEIRKAREKLVLAKKNLEKKVAGFRSLHERKATANADAVDFMVEGEGAPPKGTQPAPSPATRAKEAAGDGMESKLAPLLEALRIWESLREQMIRAEEWAAGGIASPSLAERKGRWPRDYIETKVYCYLIQHSWTLKKIVSIVLHDEEVCDANLKSVLRHVVRAIQSGRPPLVFEWTIEEARKEAARLLEVIERANKGLRGIPVRK
jgi:hypothetical protein